MPRLQKSVGNFFAALHDVTIERQRNRTIIHTYVHT